MKQTKVIDLLRLLSQKECQKFENYVNTSFFNSNSHLISLCNYLMPYKPDFFHDDLDKKQVYKAIYGSQKFNNLKFNNLTSDLLQLLKDFLAFQHYQNNSALKQKTLIDELIKRNANAFIDQQVKKYKISIESEPLRSDDYFLQKYQLQDTLAQYYQLLGRKNLKDNMQAKSDLLDLFYMIKKLGITAEMASLNKLVKSDYQYGAFENYAQELNDILSIKDNPVVQLYQTSLKLVKEEEETHYKVLKQLLKQCRELISEAEMLSININLLNFCIRRLNTGGLEYHEEVFDIYQSLLQQDDFFEKNLFTHTSFSNIVAISLQLQKTEWTKDFIQQFAEKLHPEQRTNVTAYNLAALYYSMGLYREALLQLQDVEYLEYHYHINSKYIQIKCYYALKEEEAFFALLEAFRKYNSRTKKTYTYHKQSNSNMIKMVKRIFQLRSNMKYISSKDFNKKYNTLHGTLSALSPVVNKKWLVSILEKLKTKEPSSPL